MANNANAIRKPVAASASPAGSVIPVSSINDLRQTFPGKTLVFEADLTLDASWNGLGRLAEIFSEAGLGLKALRCNQAGGVTCLLVDGGRDPGPLAARLAAEPGINLSGWVTHIQYD
ncbi:hypothetical protein HOY34_14445 [Xinfangfangia sp. D13-10-4-6]|uniref:hypothetical protein n=1 Tax=Pseudogemmobacter hezensis TaxID=2737662 RepID=UPI0015553455|nr:hypothetical protein [Pseudogemmobacter hezensis]NPD16396.1 hypothetical protein [Pseudogemmobacter hezensis]